MILKLSSGSFEVLDKIGNGSYGTAYRCLDKDGNIMVVKCIPAKKSGLPCLLEASIMSSNLCPYLASSKHVGFDGRNLYIISELGTSDLGKWTRRDKLGKMPTQKQLYSWTKSLILALCHLEKHRLVHGDVKPSNMLLYFDDTIRLTDFTLTTFSGIETGRSYYTYQYRPLEIWGKVLSRQLPESCIVSGSDIRSDVWALGCSLYEIATGTPLFPINTGGEATEVKKGSFNAILNWSKQEEGIFLDIEEFRGVYPSHRLCSRWYELPVSFRNVVLAMLKTRIQDRVHPIQLLQMEYFFKRELPTFHTSPRSFTSSHSGISSVFSQDSSKSQDYAVECVLSIDDYTRVYKFFRDLLYGDPSETLDMSIRLFIKARRFKSRMKKGLLGKYTKALACAFIARKLIYPMGLSSDDFVCRIRGTLEIDEFNDPQAEEEILRELFIMEREVCESLSYRLHG